MELVDYLRVLRRRWRLILATTLVGLLAALAYALLVPKTYAAQSKVYVHLAAVNPSTAYQSNQYVLSLMPSYSELDGSPQVLRPVIEQLGLKDSVQDLSARVTISNPSGTVYLDVDATGPSFRQAAALASTTGRQLADVIGSLQQSSTSTDVVVARAQQATGSTAPVAPVVPLDLALGIVVGLVVGMIWVLARNRYDTTVRDADELHRLTGSQPLAAVPGSVLDTTAAGLARDQLDVFQNLRTSLVLGTGGRLPASIAVVGVGCEDAPAVASDLAFVAARSGVRTCLVDADLERRSESSAPFAGLGDVLDGEAGLADGVLTWPETEVPLAVLSAGSAVDDPSGLLDTQAMARIHRVLSASFDLVVFAGAPAPRRPDALVLARDTAATVLVVRARRTTRAELGEVAETVAGVGATPAGVVLVEQSPAARRRRRRHAQAERIELAMRIGLPGTAAVPVSLLDPDSFDPVTTTPRDRFVAPTQRTAATLPSRARGDLETVSAMPPRARSSRARRLSVARHDDETTPDRDVSADRTRIDGNGAGPHQGLDDAARLGTGTVSLG